MGGKGPARTPSEKLKLAGSSRLKGREAEPEYAVAAPKMPAGLTKEAKAHWKDIVPKLLAQGIVHEISAGPLVAMCEAYSLMVRMQGVCEKEGYFATGARGMVTHPAANIMDKAALRYLRLSQEFGITPASKSRVEANPVGNKKSKANKFGFGAGG